MHTKGSLKQDVFLVKIVVGNAIGEQVRTPVEIRSGIHYRLSSPLPWAVRRVPFGRLVDRRAIYER